MPHPFRRPKVEFVTPPTEPAYPPDDAQTAKAVAKVDERLELISLIKPQDCTAYTWAQADRLLDQRLALRPARPQSRTDASIENYGKNPW